LATPTPASSSVAAVAAFITILMKGIEQT